MQTLFRWLGLQELYRFWIVLTTFGIFMEVGQKVAVPKIWEIYHCRFHSSGKKILFRVMPQTCQSDVQYRKWHHSHNNHCCNLPCSSAAVEQCSEKCQTYVYHCPLQFITPHILRTGSQCLAMALYKIVQVYR